MLFGFIIAFEASNGVSHVIELNVTEAGLQQSPQSPKEVRCEGKDIDFQIQMLKFQLSRLLVVTFQGLEIGAEEGHLHLLIRIVLVEFAFKSSVLAEMVSDIEATIVLSSVFVIDERDTLSRVDDVGGKQIVVTKDNRRIEVSGNKMLQGEQLLLNPSMCDTGSGPHGLDCVVVVLLGEAIEPLL